MGFTAINNDLLDSENLSIQEQSLLIAIISFYNQEKGYAYPSYKQIKLRSKLTDNRTLLKAMESLIKRGYITKETKKGIGNKYFINCKVTPSVKLHQVEDYTTCKTTLPPSVELHHDVVENYTTTNTNTNTKTNTKYIDLKFIDDIVDKVKITQEQYDKLINKFDKDTVHKNIIALDNYIANGKGNKYKDHYRVLNTWCGKEKCNNLNKGQLQTDNSWDGMKKFN